MDTEKISNCLNSSQPWILEKNFRKTWIHKISRIPTFCPVCRASHYEKLKNLRSKAETEFAIRCVTYPLGNVINQSFHRKFLQFLQICPQYLEHKRKMMTTMRTPLSNSFKKSWTKSFNKGIVCKRVGFQCTCPIFSKQCNQLPHKHFNGAIVSGG